MDRFNTTTIMPDRERGQHLKFEDRCTIKIYKKHGYSLRGIAKVINCSPSTIMYELRRGTGERNGNRGRFPQYSAKRGQANYEINRSRCHKPHKIDICSPFIKWVVSQVKNEGWTIDICVGRAKKLKLFSKNQILSAKMLFNEFSEVFKTITSDNESEFKRLSELDEYGIGAFLAHPYLSWERPQNKRHNRLFRF